MKPVELDEKIRTYVLNRKLIPAREQGQELVTVWARQIHAEMNLPAKVITVCRALDVAGFPEDYGFELLERSGPRRGPASKWVYKV